MLQFGQKSKKKESLSKPKEFIIEKPDSTLVLSEAEEVVNEENSGDNSDDGIFNMFVEIFRTKGAADSQKMREMQKEKEQNRESSCGCW